MNAKMIMINKKQENIKSEIILRGYFDNSIIKLLYLL